MKKLGIAKERLTELTTDDLHRVAGAEAPKTLHNLYECARTVFGCTTAKTCPREEA